MPGLKPVASPALKPASALVITQWLFGASQHKLADMTREDCGYAQSALQEILTATVAELGTTRPATVKPPAQVRKVIVEFLNGRGRNAVKFGNRDELTKYLKEPVIARGIAARVKARMPEGERHTNPPKPSDRGAAARAESEEDIARSVQQDRMKSANRRADRIKGLL